MASESKPFSRSYESASSKLVPRGIRNNNPLNIRRSPVNHWQGRCADVNDPQFEEFVSMVYGVRAALVIIKNWLATPRYRVQTPADIIRRWAPPSDGNDTTAYIARVEQLSCVNARYRISFAEKDKILRMVRAMALVECGDGYQSALPLSLFKQAYSLVR